MGQQPMGARSSRCNETSCTIDSDLGRLLMDGKVVGTMDEDGIMRYKLTPMGRVAAESEMANSIKGMRRSKVVDHCNGTHQCSSPLEIYWLHRKQGQQH